MVAPTLPLNTEFIGESIQHALASEWQEAFSSLDQGIETLFSTPVLANQLSIKHLLKRMVDVGSTLSALNASQPSGNRGLSRPVNSLPRELTEEELVTINVVLHTPQAWPAVQLLHTPNVWPGPSVADSSYFSSPEFIFPHTEPKIEELVE
jgi:hypothetical protein